MRNTRIGMKEYPLESMFLHQTYLCGGYRNCSYTCICVTGDNSAILHYGHVTAPNEKTPEDGDMALLDMGAKFHFYGFDIRYSSPATGKFTADQCLTYNIVLSAHNDVISSMRPGVSWVDIHKLAERVILESLRNGSILYGDVDEMMLGRLGAVFMPHGLGHLLGIDTHDSGGYPKDVDRAKELGLKFIRTAKKLEHGRMLFY